MVTVFAVVFVTPRIVHACSCSPDRTLSDYADEVEVAFVGRQIEGTSVSGGSAWLLEVDWVYKGRAGPLIEVRTGPGAGSCGTHFQGMGTTGVAVRKSEEGSQWGELEPGDLYVHWCFSHVSIEELEGVFGAGYPPDATLVLEEQPESFGPFRVVVVGGVAFVLVVGVAGLVRLRRRAGR